MKDSICTSILLSINVVKKTDWVQTLRLGYLTITVLDNNCHMEHQCKLSLIKWSQATVKLLARFG